MLMNFNANQMPASGMSPMGPPQGPPSMPMPGMGMGAPNPMAQQLMQANMLRGGMPARFANFGPQRQALAMERFGNRQLANNALPGQPAYGGGPGMLRGMVGY